MGPRVRGDDIAFVEAAGLNAVLENAEPGPNGYYSMPALLRINVGDGWSK
jgi:hypothetical protein